MIYLSLKTINEMPFSDSRLGIENILLRSVTDCTDGKVVFFFFFLFFFSQTVSFCVYWVTLKCKVLKNVLFPVQKDDI